MLGRINVCRLPMKSSAAAAMTVSLNGGCALIGICFGLASLAVAFVVVLQRQNGTLTRDGARVRRSFPHTMEEEGH
jgi:hypothetical protein